MALFTEQELIDRVQDEIMKGFTGTFYESVQSKARRIIQESRSVKKPDYGIHGIDEYDIFLSHSSDDALQVAGLKLELEDLGYSVYVDWINDPSLDRKKVTKETAMKLKERMHESSSLFYAFSENSSESRWMPWELGYFDGVKRKAAVLPISKSSKSEFKGAEYLGLYYYIVKARARDQYYLWVHETKEKYVRYDWWLKKNQEPYIH